nr:carboxypeptidase-like regulatory domain-containing protein [Pyrinomonadaceae bacterium]
MKASKRVSNGIILFIFTTVLLISNISAQTKMGSLQGVVTDEAQAIIPEAKLVLRDENGAVFKTKSDADGNFTFANLAFGKYFLTIEKEGFTKVEREITFGENVQNQELTMQA